MIKKIYDYQLISQWLTKNDKLVKLYELKKTILYSFNKRLSVYKNVNDLILYLKNRMKNKQKTIEGIYPPLSQVRLYSRNLKLGDNLVQERLDKFISSSIKIINKNNML